MTSLVLELQAAAMDASRKVDDLLRMALVVASKLKLAELKEWCEKELKGYGKEPVPAYRRVQGALKARNPYHGWVPVIVSDASLMRMLSERDVGQSISELEHILNNKQGGTLQIPLPHEILMAYFGDTQEFGLGMIPTLLVSTTEVHGIVAAVRDLILNWSLKLEEDGVVGSGMTFSREEVVRASEVTYNIQSFTGVLGNVSDSTVQIGDYASIHRQLKDAGVPVAERNEIEQILDDMPAAATPTEKKNVAKRGLDWVMRNSAAIGALSQTLRAWFEPHAK